MRPDPGASTGCEGVLSLECGTGDRPAMGHARDANPLGIVGPEPAVDILAGLEAPYEVDAAGRIWVDPGRLGLPETYGVGTNELGPEMLDWSDWEKSWQNDEPSAADTL